MIPIDKWSVGCLKHTRGGQCHSAMENAEISSTECTSGGVSSRCFNHQSNVRNILDLLILNNVDDVVT